MNFNSLQKCVPRTPDHLTLTKSLGTELNQIELRIEIIQVCIYGVKLHILLDNHTVFCNFSLLYLQFLDKLIFICYRYSITPGTQKMISHVIDS